VFCKNSLFLKTRKKAGQGGADQVASFAYWVVIPVKKAIFAIF